ncbi:MAG: hypothetical protein F4205_16985 [Gemmatimonadetes bacterium]|nr:hypothetical protein [Gemmatimonadota bacterium]MXX71411.1 hypothetical protein [Gemmatimonadota bacterium]MYC92082.1 hypothetical protein [Gemmatimonadota bacterium]MYG37171.1 hypothetical protein [Gemmatimonadota bacterium]
MRFLCAVLTTLLAACGGDTGGSSAPSPSEDLPLAPDFEEVYRIGGIEAEGWDAFTDIADMGFDARGHLYIRDGTARSTRIVAVDGVGALVAEFGSMGDGPGELRQVGHMVARPEGGTVIVDDGHRAYLLFGPDGSFERAVRFADSGASQPASAESVRHGREGEALFLTRGSTATFSQGEASIRSGDRTVYRVSLEGEEAATVPFADGWEPLPERRVTMETEDPSDMFGMLSDAYVYFSPAWCSTSSPAVEWRTRIPPHTRSRLGRRMVAPAWWAGPCSRGPSRKSFRNAPGRGRWKNSSRPSRASSPRRRATAFRKRPVRRWLP